MNTTPNPGSIEAREQGCRCPIMDNAYGLGYGMQPNVFVINEDCPLHGQPKPKPVKWIMPTKPEDTSR